MNNGHRERCKEKLERTRIVREDAVKSEGSPVRTYAVPHEPSRLVKVSLDARYLPWKGGYHIDWRVFEQAHLIRNLDGLSHCRVHDFESLSNISPMCHKGLT